MRLLTILVACLIVTAGTASATDDNKWVELADRSYADAVTAVANADAAGSYVRAQFVAPLAAYAGQRFGWRDQRTRAWLDRLYRLRTPTGGYGLGVPFDAFGDKTVNPADTAYTITDAWHVGRVLLAGYDGGGVPAARIREVAHNLNTVPLSAGGHCVGYSDHANDAGKPCVWNVSAAASWFLGQALRRGLIPAREWREVAVKVRKWRTDVRTHYREDLGGWTYQENSLPLQDSWHNATTVVAMVEDRIGPRALAAHFGNWPASGANADLLTSDCTKAESNFAAIRASATKPTTAPIEVLQTRTAYVGVLLEIARRCQGPR
ncbi:hypothetical protein [Amycolatopsis sp. WGS_07]|uniref:hypothetical protein n=1 Tax=Amycolatopsis sp. WGS_07 TaxID=3076764 RepID=UPI003873812B